MTKKVNQLYTFFRTISFIATVILTVSIASALGQEATPTLETSVEKTEKESTETLETLTKTDEKQKDIVVVFDEKKPGVMIIESNGKKFIVDANKKTVQPFKENTDKTLAETTNEENKPVDELIVAKSEEVEETDDFEEESIWDFEKGEEPFDYRVVNIPTPKSVPKGSWNLSFSHRFSQPVHPISKSGKSLLGFDSFSVSSFAVAYGITDKLYVNAARSPICQRGLCRTIELGLGYNWLNQDKDNPIALTTYASIEGDQNFSRNYTYNLQTMLSGRVGKRVYLFFSPAIHINSNGQRRFNPRATDFFPPAQLADSFELPKHTASFGFGTSVLITHNILASFDFTPRVGFKLGRVTPVLDENFNIVDFETKSHPTIGFAIQRNIGNHSFALTFSNSQLTTTSRYNSSNLIFSPKKLTIGFNLFRRF